ncbi:hypothetical protein Cflav_PD2611 [Pedosphaera parvula Ellin514]|uniref:Uncharacterized protein n=2 Tax=Pedosphaera TaxID=1032526 RepID=B9XKF2_PEDPL|nr:hypothetical protein Cflav_PD2611 [Pedosphaera parvula Ellin514]
MLTVTQLKIADLLLANRMMNLTANGAPGTNHVVQTSTNLMNWTPLATLNSSDGALQFNEAVYTNNPLHFYRVTAP